MTTDHMFFNFFLNSKRVLLWSPQINNRSQNGLVLNKKKRKESSLVTTIPWQPHHRLLYFCQGYYVQSNNSSTKSIYNLSIVSGWLEKNCFLSVTMATTVPYIEISVIVAVSQKIFLERTKRRQKKFWFCFRYYMDSSEFFSTTEFC